MVCLGRLHSHADFPCFVCQQGEASAVRYLYRKGIESNPRSRYIHLAWGLFEKRQGEIENARNLFKRGHELNRLDAAILQVRG